MSIFKLQKPEEPEEDIKPPRKVKDLNPQNKKVRKEPAKPWGRKERLIVLTTFLLTVLSAGFLFLSSRSWKLPNFPRIEIPKLQIFQNQTVTIGNKVDLKKEKEKEITDYFLNNTDKLTGSYSFYCVDIKNGYEFGSREKNVMKAASLIKLPVFILLFQEAEAGRINLDDLYTLKSTDIRGGSGSLQYKASGTKISYRQMALLMGKESDNTAFNIFRNIFGDQKIQKLIFDIGMISTSLADNETSAYDVSLLYKKLFQNDLINQKNTDEMLSFLTDTIYEEYIPKNIPDINVAHKYGREVNVINDAGIILTENPYILTILSEGIIYSEADIFIPNFSKFVFDRLK